MEGCCRWGVWGVDVEGLACCGGIMNTQLPGTDPEDMETTSLSAGFAVLKVKRLLYVLNAKRE
jgi:hypothetical protein